MRLLLCSKHNVVLRGARRWKCFFTVSVSKGVTVNTVNFMCFNQRYGVSFQVSATTPATEGCGVPALNFLCVIRVDRM
jgi:hypothetical protein